MEPKFPSGSYVVRTFTNPCKLSYCFRSYVFWDNKPYV